jgi:hypothetical protein
MALRSTYSYPPLEKGGSGWVIHWCRPHFIPVTRSAPICFLFTAPFDIVIYTCCFPLARGIRYLYY